jgi:uncharacterized protein
LSREEFMAIFFDDLALPNMIRTQVGDIKEFKLQRAGYTQSGAPTNMSIPRSLRQALGRRIALTGSLKQRLAELQAFQSHSLSEEEQSKLTIESTELQKRIKRVPFLDDIDLRYRHRIKVAVPRSQAVMFCLMDVSGSMDENKKDLAKRFFTLLYLFLSRKYEKVEVVFVRHTDDAEEVDEGRFFHDPKTGGTVVLSALHLWCPGFRWRCVWCGPGKEPKLSGRRIDAEAAAFCLYRSRIFAVPSFHLGWRLSSYQLRAV